MSGPLPLHEIDAVQARLAWMRQARIWPNGLRYLWTDAFGVVLLVSLWQAQHDDRLLRECEWVVAEVERVLGGPRGIGIGEEPDRDGQYFHYLATWIFALDRLGAVDRRYREKAIALGRPARVLLPRAVAVSCQVRLHQLRGGAGPSGRVRARRTGAATERVLRFVPFRRLVRHQCHHARHGVHVPFPRTLPSSGRDDGVALSN